MILFKTTLISLIPQFRTYWTTLTDFNMPLHLIEICSEKKYSKEKIYLKDTEQKTDNPKLFVTNNNSLQSSTPIRLILKPKSKRKETESQHKSQGIAKNNISKNSKKKINNFNKKSIKPNFKIKSLKSKFWIHPHDKKQNSSQMHLITN